MKIEVTAADQPKLKFKKVVEKQFDSALETLDGINVKQVGAILKQKGIPQGDIIKSTKQFNNAIDSLRDIYDDAFEDWS